MNVIFHSTHPTIVPMDADLEDVQAIVREYCMATGHTGLVSAWNDCGCSIDDMCPCDYKIAGCTPGYLVACEDCPRNSEEECTGDEGPGDTWCVFRELPTKEAAND